MADTKTTAVGPGPEATSPPAAADPPPVAPAETVSFNNSFGGGEAVNTADEWDASKVPPSRFQKRKGSLFATPGSRDGGVASNYAEKFHAKHAEKGYDKMK